MRRLMVLALLPLTAMAEAPPARADLPDPLSWGSLVQLGLGLTLVVGLILLLGWLVRRVNGTTASGQGMKVLAALPLGQRERAVLVQVGQEQLLLGVAPGRVSLIKHFDAPVVDSEALRGAAFADRLQQALGRGGPQ
ncbi:flagellar biosynthetic protein FliO [Marinobacterium weihaiense]|nr:flagellar biosynthetic protein FliO [Marinobacterium weihaiense]